MSIKKYVLVVVLNFMCLTAFTQEEIPLNSLIEDFPAEDCPYVNSAPSVTNHCGYTQLSWSAVPPFNVSWYWQSTPNGTSTANSSTTINRTSGTVYYIRAKNYNTNCWGNSRAVNYTVNASPAIPPLPTVANGCGSVRITRDTPPSGQTWYWQSSATGTSTANSSSSILRAGGTVAYLRAKSNSGNCWGPTRTIRYSVPRVPSMPETVSINRSCGRTTLSRSNPPHGITWYWQSSANGTSRANSGTTITRTSGTVYYLRARNNSSGCWSAARRVNYSIIPTPVIPSMPTITNNCGSTVLRRRTPPSGQTWYWQSSANGTSRANSGASITRTSGSVYYLRARNNSNGCWGPSLAVSYTIDEVPPAPRNIRVTDGCNNVILTAGLPPAGESWYWQDSPAGTSTSISTLSIIRTTGSIYYIRSKSNNSGCWSTATEINYTVPRPVSWYADTDGDGFGDDSEMISSCNQPEGYVNNNRDRCPDTYGLYNGCEYIPVVLSSNRNYIYTRTPQVAMSVIDSTTIKNNTDLIEEVVYMDGLGRPEQQIALKQSPDKKDIITPVFYDSLGRQPKTHLPYKATGTIGNYRTNDQELAVQNYYNVHYPADFSEVAIEDINAYSEILFEASPLNRPLKQAAPGKAWKLDSGHEIEFAYQANSANDSVRLFRVGFTDNNTAAPYLISSSSYYSPAVLYKTITRDENHPGGETKNHTTEEFKDKQDRVILKRSYNYSSPSGGGREGVYDTYYVYDDFNNLTYSIPPGVDISDGVSTTELNELCYQYKYDHRNRMIGKKVPGKGWEDIVYNKLDQPILTQDANIRTQNKWIFSKYDAFGRLAYSGMYNSNKIRDSLQVAADAVSDQYELKTTTADTLAATPVYYSNHAYPVDNLQEIFTINYYDNYLFNRDSLLVPSDSIYGQAMVASVRGLATGSKIRVLGSDTWITTITIYDKKGRPIYTASKNNELHTTDITETKLDFTGRALETRSTHTKGSNDSIVIVEKFSYDHVGRLKKHTHKIGEQEEELIAENTYDNLGQLIQKKVGGLSSPSGGGAEGGGGLQTVDYAYNIRGWLKAINDTDAIGDDLFAFKLHYNDPVSGAALYNGNISQTRWKTKNTDQSLKSYSYTYDALNRIKTATDNTGRYSLQSIDYDKNGNILSLNRRGHLVETPDPDILSDWGIMDSLSYNYDNGNKLLKVRDNGNNTYGFKDGSNTNNDYEYDLNGNLKLDRNKGIDSIAYNYLNLPEMIVKANDTIFYVYDASGMKLKKTVREGGSLTTTEYAGNYIYKNNNLEFIHTPEGYIEPGVTSSALSADRQGVQTYDYIYQYKDHLGNIRLSYQDNPTVLANDTFESETHGWLGSSATITPENGRLKVSVRDRWRGAQKFLDVEVGDTINYRLELDKATTGRLLLVLFEHDQDLIKLKTTVVNYDANGILSGEYIITHGSKLRIKIEKTDGGDLGVQTHYYLDNVRVTKKNIQIREENNYYPFGLKHRGYNNLISGRDHKFGYNGKELDEELELNWSDFGARRHLQELGRWMSIDPLADEYDSYSPFNSMMNNPINFIDPDGMAARWIPRVLEDGTVVYIAEAGDSAETLSSQYNISQDEAEAITGTEGNTKIKKGTQISGQTVKDATGSEVLKLNLKSELATEQRQFEQILFAFDHSKTKPSEGDLFRTNFITDPENYFRNTTGVGSLSGTASVDLGDRNVKVTYDFPLYRQGTLESNPGVFLWVNNFNMTHQRGIKSPSLRPFGANTEGFIGETLNPNTRRRGPYDGNWNINVHSSNYNAIKKRIRKKFPINISYFKN
ncbi:hypothetical protein GWK08_13945 [Leptobacterium flavescens]|uniref:DUF6443 domain-containing protein n=1 Tax=Leptobacterium flavescens TaxID=472055 RepID=A0A6P0UPW7_9FLAO|nr:DUF6443 domain-containing protein [Leptobacterium flavescens]NER14552.1 hypothetical protein [Leptobacterium flavescens]